MALSELLRSFGIAALLSILISVTIERANRSRFMSALTSKTRELSSSVFAGMFNRDHPESLLSAVKNHILERPLIRDSLAVSYTLSLWEPLPTQVRLKGRKFVRTDVIVTSTVRNVSTLKGEDAGIADVPLGLGLPNPMLDELKPLVRVSSFLVGGEAIPSEEIDAVNAKLQADLAADKDDDVGVSLGSRPIQPGESITISAGYTMMKEIEDTEVFRTIQISQGLTLTVNDNTNGALKIRAKALHPASLEKLASGPATTQWKLNDIILPHQGIIVWWKAPVLAQCGDPDTVDEGTP